MKFRMLLLMSALGLLAGCTGMPISDKMAENMGIPTGKPVPGDYVVKAIPVDEEEADAEPGEAPEGIAYPRKFGKGQGRLELNIRSFGSDSSDYQISTFLVNAFICFIPKDSNKRKFFLEMGMEIGYPDSTLEMNQLDGDRLLDGKAWSSFVVPFLGFEMNIVASEIEIEKAGFFEIETRIRLNLLIEEYKHTWIWDPVNADWDIETMSGLYLHPRLAVIARRMAGEPTPLEYIEPFVGLALNFMYASFEADETFSRSEDHTDIWLDFILGVRGRPVDYFYGEFELVFGLNEFTFQFALGFMF